MGEDQSSGPSRLTTGKTRAEWTQGWDTQSKVNHLFLSLFEVLPHSVLVIISLFPYFYYYVMIDTIQYIISF